MIYNSLPVSSENFVLISLKVSQNGSVKLWYEIQISPPYPICLYTARVRDKKIQICFFSKLFGYLVLFSSKSVLKCIS